MKVLIPLAEGFEEIEAVTVIDILRRAGINTVTAALAENPVTGAHKIPVTADKTLEALLAGNENFDAIILPGGMPGSTNLKNDNRIQYLIKKINKSEGLTAALCAAPIVLSAAGLLKNKKFTCYPGYEDEITDGIHISGNVVSDGSIITGKGAGCAPLFALAVVEFLKDKETANKIKEQIMAFW
jgi:4-methyl-5(b-hydroxyethyl)-thiazole monophosphate biosynthesis